MPGRIRLLHGSTSALLRSLELELLLPEIARAARTLEGADAASVMLEDEAHEAFVIVAQEGLSAEYAQAQRLPLERARATYRGFDTHQDVDLRADPPGGALVARERLARAIAMPLVHEGALIGALNVYTRDPGQRFDDVEIEILHILAAQASIAIANARLYEDERRGRRLQESLLESLGDGVIIAFRDGTARLNRAARELLGIEDARGGVERARLRDTFELYAEDGGPVAPGDAPLDRALRGEVTRGVYTTHDVRRSGTDRVLQVAAVPVHGHEGAIVAGVLTLHDLTRQREAEREKDEFLSIVSHELRTPLTPLKALAQLLRQRLRRHRDEGRPFDLDSLDTNLRTIERQVDRMSGLVNDLLEVSRAGQGRFELQPTEFDLAALVHEVVTRNRELLAADTRHTFAIDAPATLVVEADAHRVEQALTSLVGNAVKYSPKGGAVHVAADVRDDRVAVVVRDQGIGIAADELPGLGRPFARGSRRARTYSGMGIGLYLARLVAERHGGSIRLESEGEDRGTTVTFVIPRRPAG